MLRLIYHVWLNRESLLRDSRSHAPDEARSKCLDLSSICIAELNDRTLSQQLGLSTHHASHMTADDVSKLASFTYHNHPDIFR